MFFPIAANLSQTATRLKVYLLIECVEGGGPGPSSGVLVKGWVVPCAVWRDTEVVPSVAKLHLL